MSKTTALGLLLGTLLAGSAVAGPLVGVTHIDGYYTGVGGEFTLTPNAELAALTGETRPFGSFCLERSEYVDMDTLYDVAINREALQGGGNQGPAGPGGGDPLDPRTAFLYWSFRTGTLPGYDYTPGPGRALSATALQEVIWYLEDEMEMTWADGSLQDSFYTLAQGSGWNDLGNVRVLNIYYRGHVGDLQYRRQDMLITVPVPGALALGGLGGGCAVWLRRRRML